MWFFFGPPDIYIFMFHFYSAFNIKYDFTFVAASLINITKNFRLGFGSFVDKVVMPYANMVPSK